MPPKKETVNMDIDEKLNGIIKQLKKLDKINRIDKGYYICEATNDQHK